MSEARLITDMAKDVQETNTLNVSEDCPESMESCLSVDQFLEHPFSFLLLYELGRRSDYKDKIIQGFHEVCQSLKFTRVTCGVLDVYQDREAAHRFVEDLTTVPAHLLFQGRQHIEMPQSHVEKLMGKPGDVEVMKWHVKELVDPRDTLVMRRLQDETKKPKKKSKDKAKKKSKGKSKKASQKKRQEEL